ncbi:MAG: response regulator [Pseudomonadota bacterium]|jgi:two-component system chemotaxis response regulator CheY
MPGLASLDRAIPILVVDDFAAMRKVVKTCLKQLGFQNIVEAEDGAKALEKLQNGEFKLVISDWNMPNMMGLDLLKAVRGDAKLAKVPFVMVTAEAQKENVLEAAKAGVSNYIVKPFSADQLKSKLEAVFAGVP